MDEYAYKTNIFFEEFAGILSEFWNYFLGDEG